MKSKLNLDFATVEKAREAARAIAEDTQKFILNSTSVTIERTCARLLGIDGVDDYGVPLPNLIVDSIKKGEGLGLGLSFYLGNAMIQTGKTPQQIAEAVANGELDITRLKMADLFEIRAKIDGIAQQTVALIRSNRQKRDDYLARFGDKKGPYIYVIVATGNIHEDIVQAKAAAAQGADVIAVIRTTGQSLLDFVPFGATTEGFGGTFATQENFRLMRQALDEASEKHGRYIRLCNYCSGLCMPEIAGHGSS